LISVLAFVPVKQRISADHLRVLVSTPTSTPIRVSSECMIFTAFVLIGFRIKPDYTEMHTIYSRLRLQVLFPAPNQYNPNRFFSIGDGFGLFIIFTPEQIATAKKRHYALGEN
jgi:hypothetical protein